MGHVTESLGTHDTTANDAAPRHQPSRLYRALAWVGIVAGSLFIVATVFFSGYVLGQQGGGSGHHGPHHMMLRPFHGPDGPMGPGGPMGPDGGPQGPDRGDRSARLTPPAPSNAPARP